MKPDARVSVISTVIWAVGVMGVLTGAAPVSFDWFILASGPDPLKLVMSRAASTTGARVVASADCAEYRPGLFVIAVPVNKVPSPGPAGAYRKHCTAKVGSVTALGVPTVDPSFTALREEPVNFDGGGIVTQIRSGLLLRPWYTPAAQDPREGLRVEVDDLAGGRRPIERDCSEAEVSRGTGYIAVACATEQVAEQSIFRTRVYRASDLARVREVARCRKPRLTHDALICEAQAATINGQITTSIRRVPLPS